jgi:hypothetical protein
VTFFKGSRYEDVRDLELLREDGRVVRFKGTRFISTPPGRLTHLVSAEDRIDVLAHRYFNDSERWWRICDANSAFSPEDLLAEPGRTIRIPGAGA